MGLTHPGCKKRNGIDGAIAFYYYNGFMQKIIKQIKYRLATDILKEIFQIQQPETQKKLLFYKQLCRNGLIQGVPLFSARQKIRGFNQAVLIGEFISRVLKMSIIDNFERIRPTLPQAEIDQLKKRRLNIRGAFKPKKITAVKGKPVILVDDVITTGFTILELAREVKKAGAMSVYAIALAKG